MRHPLDEFGQPLIVTRWRLLFSLALWAKVKLTSLEAEDSTVQRFEVLTKSHYMPSLE